MSNKCGCGYYPTVIVPGIGQSKVDLLNNSGGRVKSAWPLDLDEKKLIAEIAPSIIRAIVLRRDAGMCACVTKALTNALEPLASTRDGFPKAQLRVVEYPNSVADCTPDERRYIYKMVPMEELGEVIGEDHLFFFAYHSFGQPYETARQLHLFIQNVKEKTGHDKVNLVPVSLGGSVSIAYFDAYGDRGDIHRVMNFVPAMNGSTLIADVLSGDIDFSAAEELFSLLFNNSTAKKVSKVLSLMPDGLDEEFMKAVLSAARDVIFVNSPAMWAVVPRERYEALRDTYLKDGRHGALLAKAERFYRAASRLGELLDEQTKRGVEFFTVCGYNRQLIPFVKSSNLNSDTIVDLKSASLGAFSPDRGTFIPKDYKPKNPVCKNKSHNHISPDRTVDASVSLFPESTWFFKDQVHDDVAYNDVALKLCKRALTDDSFKDIYSDVNFPQFNGTRNIREIRYKLLPRARELMNTPDLHEHVTEELSLAIKQCEELFTYTVVENNDLTEKAAERLRAAVQAAEPEMTK